MRDQRAIGARRAAERIAARLDLDVAGPDVEALAERGLLAVAREYKGWPLYDVRQLDELADREAELIATLVAARQAAADEDADATDADDAERLVGPDQAAERLEIRRRDFDYCVAAGWLAPAEHTRVKISRRRYAEVPLYRAGEVDDLRELPGVDWEAVRATRPGEPSPLREFAALPIGRGVLVRGFTADLGRRHGVAITAEYDGWRNRWELRWLPDESGEPSLDTVWAAITGDRDLQEYADTIVLRIVEPGRETGRRRRKRT